VICKLLMLCHCAIAAWSLLLLPLPHPAIARLRLLPVGAIAALEGDIAHLDAASARIEQHQAELANATENSVSRLHAIARVAILDDCAPDSSHLGDCSHDDDAAIARSTPPDTDREPLPCFEGQIVRSIRSGWMRHHRSCRSLCRRHRWLALSNFSSPPPAIAGFLVSWLAG